MLTTLLVALALVICYLIGRWDTLRGIEEWTPHGPHEHACKCGYTWQHDDNDIPMSKIQSAHECAACGRTVLEISKHLA